MSVTDAWIEHASALTLDGRDYDVDLGIVPGRFHCYTDDQGFGSRAGSEVTLEDALDWFARIGMPPKLKLSAYDAALEHRIDRWLEGRVGCWFRCASCERATTTGLCGCGDEDPVQIGTFLWLDEVPRVSDTADPVGSQKDAAGWEGLAGGS